MRMDERTTGLKDEGSKTECSALTGFLARGMAECEALFMAAVFTGSDQQQPLAALPSNLLSSFHCTRTVRSLCSHCPLTALAPVLHCPVTVFPLPSHRPLNSLSLPSHYPFAVRHERERE